MPDIHKDAVTQQDIQSSSEKVEGAETMVFSPAGISAQAMSLVCPRYGGHPQSAIWKARRACPVDSIYDADHSCRLEFITLPITMYGKSFRYSQRSSWADTRFVAASSRDGVRSAAKWPSRSRKQVCVGS